MSNFWYIYILLSKKDGKHYAGSTNDLKRRLLEHNSGQVHSTSYRRPLKLVYFEAVPSEKRAREREQYFKTIWGRRFIKLQTGEGQIDPIE